MTKKIGTGIIMTSLKKDIVNKNENAYKIIVLLDDLSIFDW